MKIKSTINFVRSEKDYSKDELEKGETKEPLFSEKLLEEDFELARELDDLPI